MIVIWIKNKAKGLQSLVDSRYLHINKKNSLALKKVDEALLLSPDNLDLFALKSLILREMDKTKESFEYAEKALIKFNKIYGEGFIENQLEKIRSGNLSQE